MNGPPFPGEQMLVHFYRAVVAHGDVWRQRMDATTNWAAATTAGMITVTFGVEAPHFVLLLALAFNVTFLLMESRRYRVYHLWRARFITLNRYLVAPVLSPDDGPDPQVRRMKLAELAADLGRTTPDLPLLHAVGYRVHRNYGYLFAIVIGAWMLKLAVHPDSASDAGELMERAAIGGFPGAAVVALVGTFFVLLLVVGFYAPKERMVAWTENPPTLRWWPGRSGGNR